MFISSGILDLHNVKECLLNDTKLLIICAIYVQFCTVVHPKSLVSFINLQVASFPFHTHVRALYYANYECCAFRQLRFASLFSFQITFYYIDINQPFIQPLLMFLSHIIWIPFIFFIQLDSSRQRLQKARKKSETELTASILKKDPKHTRD